MASSIGTLRSMPWLAAFAWLLMWAPINTGPWDLPNITAGGMATVTALRAALPMLLILPIAVKLMTAHSSTFNRWTSVELLFLLYGFSMLVATIGLERWLDVAYWAFSFIAVVLMARYLIHGGPVLERAEQLNKLTWMIAVMVLIVLLFTARDALFEAESGYTAFAGKGEVAGGAMSRSTGLARFAAIPAVLAFVLFWRIKSLQSWVVASLVFAGSLGFIWFMQSRGALFSLLGTLVFIMLFMGKASRSIAIVLFILALGGGIDLIPEETQEYLVEHSTRGTGAEGFKTMSGRDRIWRNAWEAIQENAWIGYGPQADRRIIHENGQNGPLYAWLSGGLLGMVGYVGGMLMTWIYYFRIVMGRFEMTASQRDMLMMTGGIMAFFTLRSYPENTAALYSIDLLVQLPAMIYIALLYRYLKARREFLKAD